jgi:hypothetical protein
MTTFNREFLDRFPSSLQHDLNKFTSAVDAREEALAGAPQIAWPPPSHPHDAFDHAIEIAWQSNGAKGVALCKGIIQAINCDNYLCFAVLFRAFFEQVLLLHEYWVSRLLPTVQECSKKGNVSSVELKKLANELSDAVRRTKIEYEEFFKMNANPTSADKVALEQVGLNKAAKNWNNAGGKLGNYSISNLYTILCDFAHPNLGSTVLCMSNELRFIPNSGSSFGIKVFAQLYPSLANVLQEFSDLQNKLLLLKFEPLQ